MPLPTYETLLVAVENGIATVTMNRPAQLNAMNHRFFAEVKAAFHYIADRPDVRVVILKGEGKHFTAGLDLKENSGFLLDTQDDPARIRERLWRHIKWLQSTFNALEETPVPVIAAIHGACIGGGVDLCAACDIRFAEETSFFSVQEIEVGIVADLGTLQRLPGLIPPGIVRELAYTGRRYTAREADKHGFVNGLGASRGDVYARAQAMAEEIAAKSPLTITGIKKVLLNARDQSVEDGLDFVATWNSGMMMGQDLTDAMQAALTKSKAEFKDRLGKVG